MTIYRSVVCEILNELSPAKRIEIQQENNLDSEMYYAHMVGRMTPILEYILESDCKIAD